MKSSKTISAQKPAYKSMQYAFLRDEAMKRIQMLSGQIWTDYNAHDPGVTILEALSYAITDLGYRTSYEIKDLLAMKESSGRQHDIKNFYTARKIFPNAPLTFNDYRKLIMDVEVVDENDPVCTYAGVKNAWVEVSNEAEMPFYVHNTKSVLSLLSLPGTEGPFHPKLLYNFLLEFDACPEPIGDLNDNFIEKEFILADALDPMLRGLVIHVKVVFARWEKLLEEAWRRPEEMKKQIRDVKISFQNLPENYAIDIFKSEDNDVLLSGYRSEYPMQFPIIGLQEIEAALNNFIANHSDGPIHLYIRKVSKVQEIIAHVKAVLHKNRNLGTDYLKFSALRIEDILICSDILITPEANVEEVQAEIFYRIGKFISPTVYFYSLEEMLRSGKTTDEIFEGPALEHGFIKDEELESAERSGTIHVSDLIRIIMEVPGVLAVKNIQIANVPQENDLHLESKSVRWCLDLAVEYNYVPRVNRKDSKITFYKEQLPFIASDKVSEAIYKTLVSKERPQKLRDVYLDLDVPHGEDKELSDYVSIQEDMPVSYGVGRDGLPSSAGALQKIGAKQLKGFLMFFDQFLADYLAQLAHVKDLFSMNAERDINGNFVIGRTYYTQPLFDIVPDSDEMYTDKPGHEEALHNIAESKELFGKRRNKFLDHLMARFAEQFTDYALMVYSLEGPRSDKELINDKLEFLNSYPELSSGRGLGMDYNDSCYFWHIQNWTGLEKRVSMLTGMNSVKPFQLVFGKNFKIINEGDSFTFKIVDNLSNDLLVAVYSYPTKEEVYETIELLILAGINKEKYRIGQKDETFGFCIECNGEVMVESVRIDFTYSSGPEIEGEIQKCISIFEKEFYTNQESSRKNLSTGFENYFTSSITYDRISNPPVYTIHFKLYAVPFDFIEANELMTGAYKVEGEIKSALTIIAIDTLARQIKVEGKLTATLEPGEPVIVNGSSFNNGIYTLQSFSSTDTETTITVSEEIPSSFSDGELLCNTQAMREMILEAEAKRKELVIDVLLSSIRRKRYYFTTGSSGYVFKLMNQHCEDLLTSKAKDFNEKVSLEIASVASGNVQVSGVNELIYEYAIAGTSVQEDEVHVTVTPLPDPSVHYKTLSYSEEFEFSAIKEQNVFLVAADLTGKVKHGDTIIITGSASNDGSYTIVSVSFNDSRTEIRVEESVPATQVVHLPGRLAYTKTYPVVRLVSDVFIIKGGEDEQKVNEMIEFMKSRFFSHEGLHVLEHVLLRPTVNEKIFIPMSDGMISDQITDLGSLVFTSQLLLSGADSTEKKFYVEGDRSTEFISGMTIHITDAFVNNGDFTLSQVTYVSSLNRTELKVVEPVILDTLSPEGLVHYSKIQPIVAVQPGGLKLTIEGDYSFMESGTLVEITGSTEGRNDGGFYIGQVQFTGSETEIELERIGKLVQDNLLQIYLNNGECEECKIKDPYSFVVSVILPYWQGRFMNMNFRKLVERTIRAEAPAHIFLNICWIGHEQMEEFEHCYKVWLLEKAKEKKDKYKLSQALNNLIDIVSRLRSVYSEGTLHDCETDDTLDNAIILNNTMIGSA